MNPELQAQIQRLTAIVAIAALIGWWLGSIPWALVLVFGTLTATNLYQLNRLSRWLIAKDGTDAPEARGIWGSIFDDIYRFQRHHRQAEGHLKSIIHRIQKSTTALKDAVVMVDSQGSIEWWNRAAKRLLGLKRPDDQGQSVINLVRDPRFIRYFERRIYSDPLEIPSPIDQRLILQYTITEFGQNERLMLIRDVTHVYHLERMRQDFVGNASHELRTPLTVIQGYLETLLDQYQDHSKGLGRALLLMESQAKRMSNLVTDMLMLSRLETTDSLSDELPIDVHHLLREIHDSAAQLHPEKVHTITLDLAQGYQLMGQERELLSAFSNLVYNAVKYTPDGGEITVRWWVDDHGGHFAVTDNGIGIEAMHIRRLTERFYRVDDGRSSAQGGTGLGLAIVKHVLLRHHATLDISSEPGQGSTFSCHFPSSLVRQVSQQKL